MAFALDHVVIGVHDLERAVADYRLSVLRFFPAAYIMAVYRTMPWVCLPTAPISS
jgi:hypothetical protein